MSEQDAGRLRQAVNRLLVAHEEASDAARRGLERRGEDFDYEDSSEVSTLMEGALVDVVDILEGASTDVRSILGDAAEEWGEG